MKTGKKCPNCAEWIDEGRAQGMWLFPDLNIQLIPHPSGKPNRQLSVPDI